MHNLTRWIEIDLDAIVHNFQEVRRLIAPVVNILAVVKSDAYGHGAVDVARALEEAGADMLAVTTIDEGIELRINGITLPILIFSPLLPFQAAIVLEYQLTPSIDNTEALEALNYIAKDNKTRAGFHLKVETGMGRTGLFPKDILTFIKTMKDSSHVVMHGVYTHLATAMQEKKDYAREQYTQFTRVLHELKAEGLDVGIAHIANTAAVLDLPEMHLDMVRVGTLLYGQYPSSEVTQKLVLKDPWKVKALIVSLKKFSAGATIGYGRDYTVKKPMDIATIPVGYADGFGVFPHTRPVKMNDFVKSTAKGIAHMAGLVPVNTVKVAGKKVPVVGRMGMQLSMIDVTGQNVKLGDEVTVGMRRTTANARLPRVYLKDGQVQSVRNIYSVSNLHQSGT